MELVVGGNYVWYLVIVVLFIGFGGAKSWKNALKLSFMLEMQASEGDNFYGEEGFSPCNTAVLKYYCKPCWVL